MRLINSALMIQIVKHPLQMSYKIWIYVAFHWVLYCLPGLATRVSETGHLLLPNHDITEILLKRRCCSKQPTNQTLLPTLFDQRRGHKTEKIKASLKPTSHATLLDTNASVAVAKTALRDVVSRKYSLSLSQIGHFNYVTRVMFIEIW